MRAFRRAAIPLLALAGVAIAATRTEADSINLLRQGTPRLSPSIIVDSSTGNFGAEGEVTSQIERDCIAIDADVRGSWSRLGQVEWRFGRFTWEWESASTPGVVYVICIDRRGHSPAGGGGGIGSGFGGGGMQLAPSAGRPTGILYAPGVIGSGSPEDPIAAILPMAEPDVRKGPTPGPDSAGPADSPISEFDPQVFDAPMAGHLISFAAPVSDPLVTDGPFEIPQPSFAAPMALDPVVAPPVPEPATWLLLGTGLAAAWRARRHRK